ncbi:hypothetical protein [Halarcobacter ebronensis]|uniref:hypothetical protein n=1 Tax=Halarcobacter ebronensis TaxID=1462615 RepID=UPI003C7106C8
MKKLFFSLTLIIVLTIGAIYGVLFTSPGNSFVASIIEDKVNEGQKDVNLKVNNFVLTMDKIVFKATIDDNSEINVFGALNIFAKSIDVNYNINIKDLSKLQNITKQKLNGSFSTKGIVRGDEAFTEVIGESLVASGKTDYDIKLEKFQPKKVLFEMTNVKVDELLYMLNQPKYATGLLNIDANIKNADINNLDGIVNTSVSNGILNTLAIQPKANKKAYAPITFSSKTHTQLSNETASSQVDFDSTIASLNIKKADYNLKENSLVSDYKLFVKSLSKLEPLINQRLNGNFTASGDVKFQNNNLDLSGTTDIFKSNTTYKVTTKNNKPQSVKLNMNDAQVAYVLNLVDQPKFATGLLNIDADIKNADLNNLDGKVITTVVNGLVNNSIVNKEFEQKLKDKISFDAVVDTSLEKTLANSIVDVNSSLANIDMKKAVYNLKDLVFTSDYLLTVADLSKLKDVTGQKMRGNVSLTGNIKQAKDELNVDGQTKLFGGDINFNLVNDNFTAKIDGVEVKDLTHMMYYPEIFTSKSNIDVNYNTTSKIGNIKGSLINGQFIQNEFSNIINTFAKFDITKEIYKTVDIDSKINKDIINTIVNMESQYTTIKVPNSTLNTKANTINALVKTKIKKYDFDTKIKGNLSNPKVSVDTSKFVKDKLKNKVKEKLEDKLKDSILKDLFNKAPTPQDQIKKPATDEEIARAFKEMFGQN